MSDAIGFKINNVIVYIKDTVARAMGLPTGGTAGQLLRKKSATNYDAEWATISATIPYPTSGTPAALGTASNGSASTVARSDHVHAKPSYGNISTAGAITATAAIANGDKIAIIDSSDSSKLTGASITFDGTTTSKALTPKGTWESMAPASHSHGGIETRADYTVSTTDLSDGVSSLATGKLYFVYEA